MTAKIVTEEVANRQEDMVAENAKAVAAEREVADILLEQCCETERLLVAFPLAALLSSNADLM